jgi:hypothetical protein
MAINIYNTLYNLDLVDHNIHNPHLQVLNRNNQTLHCKKNIHMDNNQNC